jgi:hypothetical protein
MKNIHILPTDKPSRLWLMHNKSQGLMLLQTATILDGKPQHIYITSDEEIKEGDWILDNILANKKPIKVTKELLEDGFLKEDKRIILTTDQDLIADGVQKIDDEFLEWFVKNPSCEYIKVEPEYNEITGNYYKVIIPTEESINEIDKIEKIAMDKLKHRWSHLYAFGYPKKPFPTNYENDLNNVKIGLYESLSLSDSLDKAIALLKQTTEYEVLESFRAKVSKLEK